MVQLLLLAPLCLALMIGAVAAQELHVLGAGSLREVTAEIGKRYREATGTTVVADFGPSGLLRERIEKGEDADLFASADMGHPLKLLRDGRATRVAMFTRNTLCGVAVPKVGLTTANFLDRLLGPSVKLGTSTPKADPAGDYTWEMFRRADALRPGSYEVLVEKAQQIVGGPANNAPVEGKDPPLPHSPPASSTLSSDTATAPSCGCGKCQNSRSWLCRPKSRLGRNTAWLSSKAPTHAPSTWPFSCFRRRASRSFPTTALRRWGCPRASGERSSHLIEVLRWTVISKSTSLP